MENAYLHDASGYAHRIKTGNVYSEESRLNLVWDGKMANLLSRFSPLTFSVAIGNAYAHDAHISQEVHILEHQLLIQIFCLESTLSFCSFISLICFWTVSLSHVKKW